MTKQTLHTSSQGGALLRVPLFLVLFLWVTISSFANGGTLSKVERQAFITNISRIAKAEQAYSGIPASITAAQAIFESSWGQSRLATEGNNYFGIKCKSWWTGETILHEDDDYDAQGQLLKSCFRSYQSMEESFSDHSLFLLNSERYAQLFDLDPTDYKGWAHGLKKCGYATDPQYAEKLIRLIERLNLQELDIQPIVAAEMNDQAMDSPSTRESITSGTQQSPQDTPPPPTVLPDRYKPTGRGERPAVRMY